MAANRRAVEILEAGGTAVDAVEAGVRVTEADPEDTSVGYGGYPDREGHVTLDACIMDGATKNAGAVAAVRLVANPIKLARLVLDESPHVCLAGTGAERSLKVCSGNVGTLSGSATGPPGSRPRTQRSIHQ